MINGINSIVNFKELQQKGDNMQVYNKLMRRATRLVEKLQANITTGKTSICENYGQKEISNFIDKEISILKSGVLSYQEVCNIKDILYKVSSIC
jgi:hypothetical protein